VLRLLDEVLVGAANSPFPPSHFGFSPPRIFERPTEEVSGILRRRHDSDFKAR
jgi:hypothetical protein